ncbi:hypothetical protein BDF19DRAFT_422488 [Syncephalis fuscata]|nr:hypothetical protein BDF19DRAFT_422488 [Syncephalis fuscata]
MENQLAELIEFLHDPKPEVRQLAIHHIVGFTGASANCLGFFKTNAKKIIPDMMALCEDDPATAHESLTSLINLSGDEMLRHYMNDADFLNRLVKIITSSDNVLADHACMLLSNLTKEKTIAVKLIAAAVPSVETLSDKSTRALTQLLEVFVRGSNKMYNKNADYHYLASVFANITLVSDGRSYFFEDEEQDGMLPIAKLICFTEHPAVIRRGGVIVTLKNCCFDTDKHTILLSDELGLLSQILLPLCGPEEFDDDANDKKREADDHLRITLLETLVLLTATRSGREMMRERKVYPVIRNLHKVEANEDAHDAIDRIVQMIMRDESKEQETNDTTTEDKETLITEV